MIAGTIDTARLVLRPFGDQHLTARYVAWLNDPEVTRYSEQRHHRHSLESCRRYRDAMAASGSPFWAIERRRGAPAHIGNLTAYLDRSNGVADVAILIGERAAWGNGYGVEAFGAACRWLLATGCRKVTAGTVAGNLAMRAIMRRCGMAEDGVRRRQHVIDGAEVDVVHGALFQPSRRAPG